MKRAKFLFGCLLVLLLLFTFNLVYAQDNNQSYTRGQVIEDFLNVAFSDRMWAEDTNNHNVDSFSEVIDWYIEQDWKLEHGVDLINKIDLLKPEALKKYENKKKHWPWLADYMYRPNGWPDRNVIHKWEDKITIGIGWPIYSYGSENLPAGHVPSYANLGFYKNQARWIEEVLKNIIPDLQRATGLPVEIRLPDDRREYTEEYAHIRIVPAKAISSRRLSGNNFNIVPSPREYENYFWGGTVFESSNSIQMDAYMLPKADNKLGLVICKIKNKLNESLFKALVSECLVRAMGLPDLSKLNQSSLLGDWRTLHGIEKGDLEVSSEKFSFDGISTYDQRIIGLLYCPAIKSGMDMNDVFQVLTSKDGCVSKRFR